MTRASQTTARDAQRPVLFVYIGWHKGYDGRGNVEGSHRYLGEHGDDCSEMYAFLKREGVYRCGIGSGVVNSERIDVVFVAKPPGKSQRRVVGLYLDARVESWGPSDNDWHGAVAHRAYAFPVGARAVVPRWPGKSGMRRWAYRGEVRGRAHPELLALYRRVLTRVQQKPVSGKPRLEHDEELAAFEGELRRRFVLHRSRERRLRAAKLRETYAATKRLACEVPGCGFDFGETYGELGASYAQVHHKTPLAKLEGRTVVRTSDLAIVCANCHAMIHLGGECRKLEEVRPRRRRRLRT